MLVDRRHAIDERGDVGRPADLIELAGLGQRLLQRDEIDRLVPVAEHDHLLEDAAVRVTEEIAGRDDFDGEVERFVVDQHRAEHRTLGLEIVRQRTLSGSSGNFGHQSRGARQCAPVALPRGARVRDRLPRIDCVRAAITKIFS